MKKSIAGVFLGTSFLTVILIILMFFVSLIFNIQSDLYKDIFNVLLYLIFPLNVGLFCILLIIENIKIKK